MKKLLLATGNKGKILELRALLENLEAEILVPEEIGLELQVEETGKTYAENATKKAKAFAKASGLLSLADDSGLEVAALDGAPGIFSARYAPEPGATDADRRAYLLQQLKKIPKPWSARFSCTAVLASPAAELHLTNGICKGMIISQERGEHGFGYDPIFLIPDMGMTMAELKMDEKNQISHRARAIKRMIPMLLSYL
jgi:XTP/dITP diphosphohydrolase